MAISINWPTKVINIPKADLTLIQSSPVEVRELNLNSFRLELKDLEDSDYGMAYLKTHTHNAPVAVGGVQLARVVNIVNDYTITFEDGQYAVNLVGANSNAADRVNVNQVSVRASNSAGLIQTAEIEYASFGGAITVDVLSSTTGTLYPAGTLQAPVNNFTDALTIANYRGFTTINIIGNATINSSGVYTGFSFVGESQNKTTLTINSNAEVSNCEFYDATVQGVLDGNNALKNCQIIDLSYVEGWVEKCALGLGTITIFGDAVLLDCWSVVPGIGVPIIDMGGSGSNLSVRNYNGGLMIQNKTGAEDVSIDMNSGKIILDSTVTNGTIVVRGLGQLVNDSSASVISHYLTNPFSIRQAMVSLIETQRDHHTGSGNIFYWDPYGGNDLNDGVSKETSVKTFAKAHDLVEPNNHDIIICVPGNPNGITMAQDPLIISKNYVFVRGPGRDFHMHPISVNPSNCAIDVTATGVELSSVHIDAGDAGADKDGICVTGDFFSLKDCWLENSSGHGIKYIGSDNSIIDNSYITDCGKDGIRCEGNVTNLHMINGFIEHNTGNGITFSGTGNNNNLFESGTIAHNSSYGIELDSNTLDVHINNSVRVFENTKGAFLDNGTGTFIEEDLSTTTNKLHRLIELQREHHIGTGNVWYWDPYSGNDTYTGTKPNSAFKTFAKAHDSAADNNHDIIVCIPGNTLGETIADEAITITKNYLFVRGPGRDFIIEPTTFPEDCIHVSGNGVEISGLQLKTSNVGTWNAVHITNGNFAYVKDVWIENASGNAMEIDNSTYTIINGGYMRGMSEHGIKCGNGANHIWMDALGIHGGIDSVHIDGTTSCYEIKITGHSDLHLGSGYGINVLNTSGGGMIRVGSDINIENKSSGDINDPNNKIVWEGRVSNTNVIDNYLLGAQLNDYTTISGSIGEAFSKILGLALQNYVEDDIVRDGNGNKKSSTLYIYDTPTNATTHNKVDGLLFSYDVTASYVSQALTLFKSIES